MTANPTEIPYENIVVLRGVLAAQADVRVLPSGDEICSFRINVRRPDRDVRKGRPSVDSIDCSCASAASRRVAERAAPGELIELNGHLRRRFWRSPAGVASRYEVEVISLRRKRVPNRRPDQRSGE